MENFSELAAQESLQLGSVLGASAPVPGKACHLAWSKFPTYTYSGTCRHPASQPFMPHARLKTTAPAVPTTWHSPLPSPTC